MDSLVIDSVTRRDLPALCRLYEELTGEAGDLAAMRQRFETVATNPDYRLLAAREGGELVGSVMTIVCHKLSRDCRPFLVMENFVVASRQRRRGVGMRLMAEVESYAVESGCGSIHFVSSRRRPEAHAFYAAMGYDPSEVRGFRKMLPAAAKNL